MRVAVTGTPGTGKTTATALVTADLPVIHLNEVIETEGLVDGFDDDRQSWIADLPAVVEYLAGRNDVLVESHLAHLVPMDRVVVLRCHPDELEHRLRRRGEPPSKARENAESEALDIVLTEAVDRHGDESVYEIDTTGWEPRRVAQAIEAVVAGDREPSAGTVSFVGFFEEE